MSSAVHQTTSESEGPPGGPARPTVNRAVFLGSGVTIILCSLWAVLTQWQAPAVINAVWMIRPLASRSCKVRVTAA